MPQIIAFPHSRQFVGGMKSPPLGFHSYIGWDPHKSQVLSTRRHLYKLHEERLTPRNCLQFGS